MAAKATKTYGIIFGLLILIIIIYNLKGQKMEQQIITIKPEWMSRYALLVSQENISPEDLMETPYYDYTNPFIQEKISQLLLISDDPKEYVANAAEMVFISIDYDYGASDFECINGIASKNFAEGSGDCTEQGMSLIALLRGAGIPARAVGGCLYRDRSAKCNLFAAIPFKQPRYKEITQEDIQKGVFSRRQVSGSRSGGLHLYVTVLLPTEDADGLMIAKGEESTKLKWVIVEPTTGEIVKENSCYLYDEELIVPNDRKDLFCTSNSISYSILCSQK